MFLFGNRNILTCFGLSMLLMESSSPALLNSLSAGTGTCSYCRKVTLSTLCKWWVYMQIILPPLKWITASIYNGDLEELYKQMYLCFSEHLLWKPAHQKTAIASFLQLLVRNDWRGGCSTWRNFEFFYDY